MNKLKHGMSKTKIYNTWINIKSRCYYKKNKRYKNYGARGIKVCDEWLNDFLSFYNWAMKNGYQENLTIDRINNNGNYEPNNCRWINNLEQQSNRGNNRLITYKGETKALCVWARIYNLKWKTLQNRLNTGWDIESALETKKLNYNDIKGRPNKKSKKIYQYDLEGNLIKVWSCLSKIELELGFCSNAIRECCKKKTKKSYNYIWCYENENPNLEMYKRPQRKILQFNLENRLVATYESAYEASKINNYNHNNIRAVCNKNRKTYKGYRWEYE